MQKCWDGNLSRRPQIQEVVEGMGNAAAKWRVVAPPSPMEYAEDSAEEESDELPHGGFPLAPVVSPALRISVQWGYFSPIRATTHKPGARV